ncbi:hypothetical protein JTE90_025838 [Oedothorax gibbosus]|uniref:RRM domain-containing protein n=1 Tax=Oedothorax gibbosus TaxID=931172 RepID=A0AAV6UTI7_9ARAC|nr:hypothetical protein JTE90_025838 [Oedothorax gibbosus]
MSIIIRLQNLPLSAKSRDIRQFFGSLNIPNGGVHIVGGEKGDAFIVFTSDEDARVAMRLDGKRILENKVKLYLSSQMEMHHEIVRITKKNIPPPLQKLPIKSPLPEREAYYDKRGYKLLASGGKRDFPPFFRPNTRSRSPNIYESPRRSRSPRKSRSPRRYSRSPKRYSRSPKRYSRSPRRRSRSPRRYSRSPRRDSKSPKRYSRSPRRYSRSPKRLSRSPGRMSRLSDVSSLSKSRTKLPVTKDFNDSNFSIEGDTRPLEEENLMKLKKLFGLECAPKEVFDWQNEESKKREESLFEKKIAEVLASGLSSWGKLQDPRHSLTTSSVSEMKKPVASQLFNSLSSNLISQSSNIQDMNSVDGNHLRMPQFLSTPSTSTTDSYVPNTQPLQYGLGAPPSYVSNTPMLTLSPPQSTKTLRSSLPETNEPPVSAKPSLTLADKYNKRLFFVTFTGMKPGWDYAVLRVMLQGLFLNKNNIRYEKDVYGKHTGTIIVKFCNRDDYNEVLRYPSYYFKKRVIHVSECPESMYRKYFDITSMNSESYTRSTRYVRIKGLHYDVTTEQVLSFFDGLEVIDLYIVYAKYSHGYIIEGKAIGIAYVLFGNVADYEKAFSKDGELFLGTNRTIHFMKASKQKMLVAKQRNRDMLHQSKTFIPACLPEGLSISDLPEKRPLCVFVTGLPENITRHPVVNFFKNKGAKPSFVYLPMDDKGKKTIGRAFIAFDSLLEFDKAQQCHGTKLGESVIFVKQILHDEMMNSLPEYEKHLHVRQLLEKVRKPVPSKEHLKHMDFLSSPNKHNIPSKRSLRSFDDDSDSRDSLQFLRMHRDYKSRSPNYSDKYYGRSVSPEASVRSKKFDHTEKVTDIAANLDAKIQQVMYRSAKIENTLGHVKKRIQHEKALLAASEMTSKIRSPKPKYALSSSPRASAKEKRSSMWSPDDRSTLSPQPSFPRKVSVRSDREHSPMDASLVASFKNSPRKRYRMEYRTGSPDVLNIDRHSSPPRKVRRALSPPPRKREIYSDPDEKHAKYQETVVQLCHVGPTVGSSELKDLFIDFPIDINKIVRRVTDRGTCTGDVRVTFASRNDAERAVRLLNGTYLNGTAIDMFVVE